MKLPLWVYDYEAKRYILFPHPEMFTTLSDGSIGFKFTASQDEYVKSRVFRQYRHHFELNPIGWPKELQLEHEFRLKRQ